MSSSLYDALERAVKALKAHPRLPETISIALTEDGLWVTPWIPGAPLTSILAWHDELREPSREFESMDGYSKVEVRGFLDDVPIIAQVVTFQELSGRRDRLSEAELRRAARAEEPFHMESI